MKKVIGQPSGRPYSPGVVGGNLLFVAGQVGSDPKTGEMPKDLESQTRNCLERVKAIVEQAGSSMDKVLRCGVYLVNGSDFEKMNAIYKTYFPVEPPARTTIVAPLMGEEYLVEIDAVALVE